MEKSVHIVERGDGEQVSSERRTIARQREREERAEKVMSAEKRSASAEQGRETSFFKQRAQAQEERELSAEHAQEGRASE